MSLPLNTEPYVLRTIADGIATLTLNRPDSFNALSTAMLAALDEELETASKDPAVRVIILQGAGRAFCAGHDLKEMQANRTLEFQQALFRRCSELMMKITRLPQPVIARVHATATAAGCQLVAMCDLAVAAEEARFAVSGINAGIFCTTPGVALGRNVSRKQAFEMLVTGDFISAAEACRRGLVNRVVPLAELDAETGKLAAAILAKSPQAIRAGKEVFYRQLEMGMDAAYQLATESMACAVLTEDAAEGMSAFIQKRPPIWQTPS